MNICALCASHISNNKRFVLFDKLLNSVMNQTVKITLHISISFEEGLENDIDDFIKKWSNYNIIFYKRPNKLAQFRHYSLLIEDLMEILDHDTNVIFTDDDDMWAPERVKTFLKCIEMYDEHIFIISNSIIRGRSIEDSVKIEDKDDEYISICTTLSMAMRYIIISFYNKRLESLVFDLEFYKIASSKCPKYSLYDVDKHVGWLYFYQTDPDQEHITNG